MRREFTLPEDDVAALNARGLPWETLVDKGSRWLFVHELPVPPGYNTDHATAAIRVEANYPPAALDMVYFQPDLERADGKPIRALSVEEIGGQQYQRWSRHYPWNPQKDSLTTHLLRVENWLEAELKLE